MDARTLIDRRYSCRTYLERPISGADREALTAYMASKTAGRLGSSVRFGLIAASPDDAGALRRLGTYGFIKGATGYIVGAVRKGPGDLEDYGYLLEEVILQATELGLGTCWLGGTFTRSSFTSRFGGLDRGEIMPAVVSIGYPGDDGTERIREREEGTRRFPPDELFFAGEFGRPLGRERRTATTRRWRPCAWRRRPPTSSRGASSAAATTGTSTWCAPRGTARAARSSRCCASPTCSAWTSASPCATSSSWRAQCGRAGRWVVDDPGLTLPGPGIEYTATWRG